MQRCLITASRRTANANGEAASLMFGSLYFILIKYQLSVKLGSRVQGSRLFVTYTIIQGIISSEMEVRTGPLNGQCKKNKR